MSSAIAARCCSPSATDELQSCVATTKACEKAAWRAHPNANVAIVPDDGLVAFDLDSAQVEAALAELGLPPTIGAQTGRGRHFYFELPKGQRFTPPAKVEIKQDGMGGITVPPSRHHSGKRYRWLRGADAAADLVLPAASQSRSVKVNFAATRKTVAAGGRNPSRRGSPVIERFRHNRARLGIGVKIQRR